MVMGPHVEAASLIQVATTYSQAWLIHRVFWHRDLLAAILREYCVAGLPYAG